MPKCDVIKMERTPEQIKAGERFTGYNLPTIRLDDGFDYYYVDPHPTLLNQPAIWQPAAFQVGFNTAGGNVIPLFSYDIKGIQHQGITEKQSPILPV